MNNNDFPFEPPYYAVIFNSHRTEVEDGYHEMNEKLFALAEKQTGYLGMNSFRNADGVGVSILYWKTLEDIKAWGQHPEHLIAQKLGREKWYHSYRIRICKVERERHFDKS